MSQKLFNKENFIIGANVYILRDINVEIAYGEYFNHLSMFKSKIVSIDFEKGNFKVKHLKNGWESFNFKSQENGEIFISHIHGGTVAGTFKLTIIPINNETFQLYQEFRKKFVPLKKRIKVMIDYSEDFYKKQSTRRLMNFLRFFQELAGQKSLIQRLKFSALKRVLSTRENIPNRREAKELRKKVAKTA